VRRSLLSLGRSAPYKTKGRKFIDGNSILGNFLSNLDQSLTHDHRFSKTFCPPVMTIAMGSAYTGGSSVGFFTD
jgi:hypothetical protein